MAKKLLDLPYHTQLNNDRDHDSGWWNECSFTSMAMFLRGHGLIGNGDGQFEDQIERSYEKLKLTRGAPEEMSYWMNNSFPSCGWKFHFTYTATWDFIHQNLRRNKPVILHTWLTGSGHVIVQVGYDDSLYGGVGANIFHDPFGEWCPWGYNTNKTGANVPYSYPLSKRLIGTDGDLWCHYSVPKVLTR